MARVKRGVTAHARHKKMLEAAKGHRATSHTHYGRAKESLLHAWSYAYAHRRERKGDMRRLWITRINAASRANGLPYGQLIAGLKAAGGELAPLGPVELGPAAFGSIADAESPQGVAAVFPIELARLDVDPGPLLLVLDGLQDPGNLGTIVRSAVGSGVVGTLVVRGGADPF